MPLTSLPDQGIEVPLSEYNRLRAFQGGGWFWDHDNQQVIRETLGDFLPRVEERRDRGGALFQHFVGGTEAVSRSQAVGAQMNRVPRAEYQRLQRALENLKLKAQAPNTDPNARKIIEKFCLPDPAKDPDLYRLYGSGWNRRLIVLWGCEREEGSSLAPGSALNKIAVESPAATLFRRLPMLLGWLLLLLLLAAGAYWWWQRHEQDGRQKIAASQPASGPAAPTADPSTAPRGSQTPTAFDSGVPPVGPVGTPDNPSPSRQNANVSGSDGVKAAGTVESIASAAHSTERATENRSTTDAASAKETADHGTASHAARLDQRGQPASPPDDAAANPAVTKAGDPPAAGATQSASPSTPPRVEFIKEQSDATPHDGKLDVAITAVARASDDGPIPLEIVRWSIDDHPQRDRAGKDVTTGQLNLSLSPGTHHVSVRAKAQGVNVEADKDLEVKIESQGNATFKPRGAK